MHRGRATLVALFLALVGANAAKETVTIGGLFDLTYEGGEHDPEVGEISTAFAMAASKINDDGEILPGKSAIASSQRGTFATEKCISGSLLQVSVSKL